MALYPPFTDLVIDGIEIPDFASRGITFTLEPVEQSRQFATDVNGELVDISLPQFRKRRLTITCTEMEAPIFDDVWAGQIYTVTLIAGLGVGSEESTAGALQMEMMVTGGTSVERDEWAASGTWSLELTEVRAQN